MLPGGREAILVVILSLLEGMVGEVVGGGVEGAVVVVGGLEGVVVMAGW